MPLTAHCSPVVNPCPCFSLVLKQIGIIPPHHLWVAQDAKKPQKVALKRAVALAEAQAAEASDPNPKKPKVESEQLPVPDGQGF